MDVSFRLCNLTPIVIAYSFLETSSHGDLETKGIQSESSGISEKEDNILPKKSLEASFLLGKSPIPIPIPFPFPSHPIPIPRKSPTSHSFLGNLSKRHCQTLFSSHRLHKQLEEPNDPIVHQATPLVESSPANHLAVDDLSGSSV